MPPGDLGLFVFFVGFVAGAGTCFAALLLARAAAPFR